MPFIDDRPAPKRSDRAMRASGVRKSAHDPEKLKRDTYAARRMTSRFLPNLE